jgi:hypothetical protein
MKQVGKWAFGICCGLGVAAPFELAQAAPMSGLSQAAASVEALAAPDVTDLVPDTVHYRRHRPYRDYCLASFYRCFYGDSPRYSYPSYRYRLDAYTYYYPPFYW